MRTVIILVSFLIATPALAAKPKAADGSRSDQDADEAAKVTEGHYIYDDDVLTGDVLGPDGKIIQYRRPEHHPSLITLRAHFLPELIALGEDI